MAEKQKIVAAVATAGGAGSNVKGTLAKQLEAAMSAAVQKCMDAGITDPEKIRQAQHEARAEVMKESGQ